MNPNVTKSMAHYCVRENEAVGNHTFARLPQEWETENNNPSFRSERVVKPNSSTTLFIPQPGSLPCLPSYSCLCFNTLSTSAEHFRLKSQELPLDACRRFSYFGSNLVRVLET